MSVEDSPNNIRPLRPDIQIGSPEMQLGEKAQSRLESIRRVTNALVITSALSLEALEGHRKFFESMSLMGVKPRDLDDDKSFSSQVVDARFESFREYVETAERWAEERRVAEEVGQTIERPDFSTLFPHPDENVIKLYPDPEMNEISRNTRKVVRDAKRAMARVTLQYLEETLELVRSSGHTISEEDPKIQKVREKMKELAEEAGINENETVEDP